MPRSIYVPTPFHIVQTRDWVATLHERVSWRLISLARTRHLPDTIRLWQGDSIGHWDGDALVVETTNFNGKTWGNEVGDVFSHAEHVVERFKPVDANTIAVRGDDHRSDRLYAAVHDGDAVEAAA